MAELPVCSEDDTSVCIKTLHSKVSQQFSEIADVGLVGVSVESWWIGWFFVKQCFPLIVQSCISHKSFCCIFFISCSLSLSSQLWTALNQVMLRTASDRSCPAGLIVTVSRPQSRTVVIQDTTCLAPALWAVRETARGTVPYPSASVSLDVKSTAKSILT